MSRTISLSSDIQYNFQTLPFDIRFDFFIHKREKFNIVTQYTKQRSFPATKEVRLVT